MALGTAFAAKYRDDPFLRTEYNIIGLQVAFALVTMFAVWGAFVYLSHDLAATLVAQQSPSGDVAAELETKLDSNFAAIIGAILLTTAAFGYLIARLALIPSRSALQAQKQFIGNIAHELRTPLSIIKTNTEVRLLDKNLPDEVRKMHESNIEELDRVSNIINNLLSLSAFVRPERIEFSDVDLGAVTDRAVQHLAAFAQRKNITLTVRKSEYRMVLGNASGLEQIVTNLIKNALNYTAGHGNVTVTIEPDYLGHIELSIKDTGIGIEHKDLFRIFEPFYRAERSRTKIGASGSGLGLTIVSELVKLHHGKITIQSAPKRGTTVRVLLPVGRQHQKELENKSDAATKDEIAIDFS